MYHFCLLLIISDPGQCADLGDEYSTGMIGAPKVGPARPKIVSAQPSPLAQLNPPGWAGLDFRKPSLDEAK